MQNERLKDEFVEERKYREQLEPLVNLPEVVERPTLTQQMKEMIVNSPVQTQHFLNDCQRFTNCVRCRKSFVPREQLGQWSCLFHPSRYNERAYPAPRYDCCKKTNVKAPGCVRCDHDERLEVFSMHDNIEVTLPYLKMLGKDFLNRIDRDRVILFEERVFVLRYDVQTSLLRGT